MLVLSRKHNESCMIGDSISVTVVDIRGDKVRLGFCAPQDVGVHRMEVYRSIHRIGEQRDAPLSAAAKLVQIAELLADIPATEPNELADQIRDIIGMQRESEGAA